ncbi:MAG: PKD domain-containing protein [Patescibacteria group bacterium]
MANFNGNTVSVIQDIVNQPPTVDAGGPYQVDEGGSVQVSAIGQDPENGPLTYAWDLDNNGSFETTGQTVAFSAFALDGPDTKTIAVQVIDGGNLTASDTALITINNVVPVAGIITAPLDPVLVNTTINTSASFTDAGTLDTHTALWDWGDSTVSSGVVTESNGSGTVTGTHAYTAAGVYTITLTVTDDDLGVGTNTFMCVVVYNPQGGFLTGAGRYDTPAGSISANPTATGMTNFGTNAKYVDNVLRGETRLNFRDGQYVFKFDSTSYYWLVVTNGNQAQLRGTGTVNGVGNYTFQLTALDSSPGMIRIQIWDATNTVVYDNSSTALVNGNIKVHN